MCVLHKWGNWKSRERETKWERNDVSRLETHSLTCLVTCHLLPLYIPHCIPKCNFLTEKLKCTNYKSWQEINKELANAEITYH